MTDQTPLDLAELRGWIEAGIRMAKEHALEVITRADTAEALIVAVRKVHTAKHGEKPVYASDDWRSEREPIEWVAYAICTGCSASYPCPTIIALDGTV